MAGYAAGSELAPLPGSPTSDTMTMLNGFLERPRVESPAEIRADLREAMFDRAFVVRTEAGLKEMRDEVANLRDRYAQLGVQDKGSVYNTDLMETVELGFLLDCAETLVEAALARDESRGGHYREDHPLRDDVNWLKHSLAYRDGDGVRLEYKPVAMGPYEPMERKY
jgi:succinate dehydrogenase / fumarate reductase flavoprotein subunit